ncbi:hypothetical protein ACFQJ7_05390 [Halovenus rubra]|uniref:Uncharacterized protein n=2 Tax=Halovenus rubra TaxID=869890 RepID=A0ACC7DXC8_9EURY|nr:hypothetical protein [Halovenus rubra]
MSDVTSQIQSSEDTGGEKQSRGIGIETTNIAEEKVESISRNEIFYLLSNERRVAVLRYLAEQDSSEQQLGGVVEKIASWENDKPVVQLGNDERHRVYTSLRQAHLPALDEADVINFNKNRGIVSRGNSFDRVHEYLEYDPSTELNDEQTTSLFIISLLGLTGLLFSGLSATPVFPSFGLGYSAVIFITLVLTIIVSIGCFLNSRLN